MAAYYFDSSGLVKRYVTEAGTAWVRGLTHRNAGHQIFLSRITAVEVTAAVARRRRGRTLSTPQASSILSRFRKHLAGRYTILELTPGLLTDAMKQANTHELRAYDAVQLAAAIELNHLSQGGIVFVSADQDLNDAAIAEGLAVENPKSHSSAVEHPGTPPVGLSTTLLGKSRRVGTAHRHRPRLVGGAHPTGLKEFIPARADGPCQSKSTKSNTKDQASSK